jgi:7,8-dihydropterin-6-yl-methyl-4-(beta-D-ribofuranosyl)aminobenzene 5'-phosphate synthase
MRAVITNLYSNKAGAPELQGDHGQSFLIEVDGKTVLLDVGADGGILLSNMKALGVSPDGIDLLVLSHGHYDHTRGLPGFLDARTRTEALPVYAHPAFSERKVLKAGPLKRDIGAPELTPQQRNQIDLRLEAGPVQLTPHLQTTGEIFNRLRKDGREPLARHEEAGKLVEDPVRDDISLILATQEGTVVITGCAHAGILNILSRARGLSDAPIATVIGGTHMARFTPDEVKETAAAFRAEFDNPRLYLNHCTQELPLKLMKQTPAIGILADELDPDRVREMLVGEKLEFELG